MIDLACPKCGRAGSIPREKINTRLVCKKCHAAFHMNTAGRTLLGEPHAESARPEAGHQHHNDGPRMPSFEGLGGLKDSLPTVSMRSLLLGVAAIVVGGGLFMIWSKPPEPLADAVKLTAERFAEDDLAYLKQVASSDTVDDVVRWFDVKHPELVKSRDQWKSKGTHVQVTVIGEDRRERRGEALAFIYPAQASLHAADIADAANAANATATPVQPMNL